MESVTNDNLEDLKKRISKLEFENSTLKDELLAVQNSLYLQHTIAKLHYSVTLNREEIKSKELTSGINEKQGSLFEIKNQIRKYAPILGLDPDGIRIIVTEAIQNIIEHGYGPYAEIALEINNLASNPYFKISFKHEMEPGRAYTLAQIEENAKKGDITSESFDWDNPRGRGEFMMKELSDERQIINGVEYDETGRKIHYFKRILINYKNPKGERVETSFDEIREEIDRLDKEEVVCYFHIDHKKSELDSITVITSSEKDASVKQIMHEAGFQLTHKDNYSKTSFCTFKPNRDVTVEEIKELFASVRKTVTAEVQHKLKK
ncbi:MAG: ATP-binding protein [Leptospiraceae bacterium]|nr:ATP-binding protein [Leptospiraceae bacterium]